MCEDEKSGRKMEKDFPGAWPGEMRVMNTQPYREVLHEAEKLSAPQCLMLIERLVHHVRMGRTTPENSLAWEHFGGSAPYPLCGEDAQEWVSLGRNEPDHARVPR